MAWRAWWSLAWRGIFGALVGYWCWGLYWLLFEADEIFAFENQVGRLLIGFIIGIPLLAFVGVFIGTVIYGLRSWTRKNVGSVLGGIVGGTIGGVMGAVMFYWHYAPGQRRIEGMSKVLWSDVGMGLCIGFMAALMAGLHKKPSV